MFALFAQGAKNFNNDAAGAGLGGLAACFGVFGLVYFLIFVLVIAGMWKVFTKAGQPGWAAIVPFYNIYVLVIEIARKDMVWFLLSIFVPFAVIIPMMDVAEKFGKSRAYGLGLAFLGFIFWPMLGFSDARYQGGRKKQYDDDYDDDYDDRPRKKKSRDDDFDDDEDDAPRQKKKRRDDGD